MVVEKLLKYSGRKSRIMFIVLVGMMVLASVSEMMSIGAVVPFLAFMVRAGNVNLHEYGILESLFYSSTVDIRLLVTLIFASCILTAGILRFCLNRLQIYFSHSVGSEISFSLYKSYLHKPFDEQVRLNSSDVISSITFKTEAVVAYGIMPRVNILSNSIMLLVIFGALLYVNKEVTTSVLTGCGCIYLSIILLTKKKLRVSGATMNRNQEMLIKSIRDALGGIRDIILDNTYYIYEQNFKNIHKNLSVSIAHVQELSTGPKFLIESLGAALIAAISYFMFTSNPNGEYVLPVLGATVLGVQRILPVAQQLYNSSTLLITGRAIISEVLAELEISNPNSNNGSSLLINTDFQFNEFLSLRNICFKYPSQKENVLENLSIDIGRGLIIGICGKSGAGKSTLIDLMMGLLAPTAGNIIIDGKEFDMIPLAFRREISHVPQHIFMTDQTIAENIAFGVEREHIDYEMVFDAAKKADIFDAIQIMPEGFETIAGEYGARLSGGQRQRIGIARALYKNRKILVLDEATSALDHKSERNVMSNLRNLQNMPTVIMVAHRLTTLRYCDKIYEVDCGSIVRSGSYKEMFES